jgi:ribosomal protein S18 acetylase RimI-like enzyme
MVILHPITPQLASSYREVRLRALRDTPSAFGSTYQRESQFSADDWIKRAENLCTERSVGYLAFDDGKYCGIAACFLNDEDRTQAELVSMWVAAEYRRTGTGRLLVDAITTWAKAHGAKSLLLLVTSSNDTAMQFYRRIGFSPTGRTEPYPNDPLLIELEMCRAIS